MLLARSLKASGIIVPLYIFPGDPGSCAAWSPLISQISAHPDLPFYLIVNPDSGPGATGSQPSASYQSCIPEIKAANTIVVGYVPTGFGDDSTATIEAGVSTYAGWDAAYRPAGIFFDQVNPTTGLLSFYQGLASNAKASFNSGDGFVILNPGSNVGTSSYFDIANLIVTVEDFFDDWSPSEADISSSQPASQQAVILHDAPAAPDTTLISEVIGTDGFGALYLTDDTENTGDDNPYDSLPTEFSTFVSDVSSAAA